MSKQLSHSARLSVPDAASGGMIRHVVRMALYWLCVTTLLWSNQHPLAAWELSTVLAFWVISSIVVPGLALLALWLRGGDHDSQPDRPSSRPEPPHPLAATLGQTGLIGAELLTTLVTVVAVEHLLF